MIETNISEQEVEVVEYQPIQTEEQSNYKNMFDDNWYKLHPEKILGLAYESSGKFGKVIKYRGGIEVLSKIQVDENFVGNTKILGDPLASASFDINVSAELQKPEISNFVSEVVEKSFEELKTKKKISEEKTDKNTEFTPTDTLNSFSDTFKNLNPEISLEEVEVYTWYKSYTGKPLSKNYVKLFKPEMFEGEDSLQLRETYIYEVEQNIIDGWVSDGLLFYYDGELLPKVEYQSGNMYDKKIKLNSEKDTIISKYGEEVYKNQEIVLIEAYNKVYEKRLLLGGENSLTILANSKLAEEFKISRINDVPEGKKFRIVMSKKSDSYGKPDFIKDTQLGIYEDYKRKDFDELNLRQAFGYWMFNSNPVLNEPVSYLDIYRYYVNQVPIRIQHDKTNPEEVKKAEVQKESLKINTQNDGERLFAEFLSTQLLPNDKVKLETIWNIDYNNYLPIDLNKVPVAFTMTKYIKGQEEVVMPEKRDAVAFTINNGTGVLAYDVGVGKTPSAIYTMSAFMDAGYCKRPLLVVPNQVYRQFIGEIRQFCPHIPVIDGYNLGKKYIENFLNVNGEVENVPNGTITVITYEGFKNIGFNQNTLDILTSTLYEILNQGSEEELSEKQGVSLIERIETIVGKGLKGGMYSIEDFGFDFMCYDEAHKMKKVFTSVKAPVEEEESDSGKIEKVRGKNTYQITSGSPSSIGLKGFMINYYILQKNNYKNILMLTATPFTNSPLEIFSMLSMVAYEKLKESNLDNLKAFFDNYVSAKTDLVINSRLKPQYKEVIMGFNNLISLQSLIRRFILYKSGDEIKNLKRPKKYVLPYLKEIENDVLVDIPEDRKIETYIPMTQSQSAMMDEIVDYVENGTKLSSGDSDEEEIQVGEIVRYITDELDKKGKNKKVKAIVEEIFEDGDEILYSLRRVDADEEPKEGDKNYLGKVSESKISRMVEGIEVDEDDLNQNQKLGVRTIKGLSYSRNLALSPYLYKYSGLGKPKNYKDYVENSPKLLYVMKCIKSVRDYCISNNQPVAGQVIYMDRGIQYFGKLKEYLVNEIGYAEHEIGIIKSGLPKTGVRSKEYVKNLFNGEVYNEKTELFEDVDDSKRLKIVIGSSTIKEGMNLQKYGAVLYNCFIDWNPTDIQQLEGRIYRQKNTFDAVRIVNPLVVDSADIFLFQKLQEKTSRLNSIWQTDGKTNALNTAEFNPEELKFALIRNPITIAGLKITEQKKKIEKDLAGLQRQLDAIAKIRKVSYTVKYRYQDYLDNYREFREFKETPDKIGNALKLLQAMIDLEKKQTDSNGLKLMNSYDKRFLKPEELEKVSPIDGEFKKPYGFSDFAVDTRDLNRYYNNFIKQYNIPFDIDRYDESLKLFESVVNDKVKEIKELENKISSEENVKIIIEEVIAEKEKQKINYKPVPQLVADFSKLNYLLDKKKVQVNKVVEKYTTCPPMEADGVTFATDEEAVKKLTDCINKEPQTKSLYYDENTGYTIERRKLHNEIINDLFKNVKCVKSGEQPIAIFTGGSPASGKSYFITKNAKFLMNDFVFKLDADEIRAKLPEYKGWNANSTQQETSDIVNEILDRLGSEKCRYDFIYDGTMNKSKKYFPLIKKVKELGYKVYIIFMEVPYSVAKERVLKRYKEKGRYVPTEVIDDFFTKQDNKTKGQVTLDQLKTEVDGYIVADGQTGEVISDGGEGLPNRRSKKVYGTPVLEEEVIEETPKKASKEDVMIKIEALQILADLGNEDAENTIEILKLLL